MDNYYTKYIKYKSKYLELKRANDGGNGVDRGVIGSGNNIISGGSLGYEDCSKTPLISIGKTVWWYLRKYNCKYEDLKKKIPKKVNAITYEDFKRTNAEHPQHEEITIKSLIFIGFPIEFLRERGFLEEIKKNYEVHDILYLLYTHAEIQDPLVSLDKLKNYNFTIKNFGKSFGKNAGKYLKRAGFNAIELKNENYSALSLKQLGFNFQQLLDAKFSAENLRDAKFSAEELKYAGFNIHSLEKMGYTLQELKKAGFSAKNFKEALFRPHRLEILGFSLQDLKSVGFSAIQLIDDLYNDINIKEAGFSEDEIKKARILYGKLKESVPLSKLKTEGVTAKELREAGYNAEELREAGYSAY